MGMESLCRRKMERGMWVRWIIFTSLHVYTPESNIATNFCHNTAPKGNGMGMKMAGCSSMTICHCPQQHWGNGNWSCTTYRTTCTVSLAQSTTAEEGGDLLG